MSATQDSARDGASWGRGAIMFAVASLAVVGVVSPVSLWVVVVEGPVALAILFAGLGLGALCLRITRVSIASAVERIVSTSGLGLGALSVLMLGAGVMGWMNRGVWMGVVGVLGVEVI